MKALRFEAYGPPSALAFQDLASPIPGPGEVLVEVHASAINPSDAKLVAGAFNAVLPRTPGRDYAGVVVTVGSWQGKEVWGSGAGFGVTRDGAHAQFVAVPSDWHSEKPAELSVEQASASGVPYVTSVAQEHSAWLATFKSESSSSREQVPG